MGSVNLNSVKTGGNGPFGCLNKAVDHVIYIKVAHGVRHRIRCLGQRIILPGGERAGSKRAMGRIHLWPGHPTTMKHLHNGHRTGPVNFCHHLLPSINLGLTGHSRLARIALTALIIRDNGLRKNQPHPLLGPTHQKIKNILAGNTLQPGRHPGHGSKPKTILEKNVLNL